MLGLLLALAPVVTAQAWLDPAWGYRSAVVISNPGWEELSNFQVNLSLDSSFDFAKANNNGSDVRFTSADGTTLIPFWIESWNPVLGTASIWIKIPSIPSSGTTLYLYYGNPNAAMVSNGTATFDFFDDFDSTSDTALGYYQLGSPRTVLIQDQAWEFSAPHTLSVVKVNAGGYTYWGYYGTASCGEIGLAFSNDLANWIKYSGNPLVANGRWPSVLKFNNIFYMLYTKDFCGASSYIKLAVSSDGIHFSDLKTIVEPQPGQRNQNPNLFFNQNDGKYYIYWFNQTASLYLIRARSAYTIEGLNDSASETIVLQSYSTLAAPNMLFYDGAYFLSTESLDINGDWITLIFSSASATSGFTMLPGNPVLSNDGACFFQHVFGNTLHCYNGKLTSGVWTLEYRTGDLTAGRQQFYGLPKDRWTASGSSWTIVTDTQQDGSTGGVVEGVIGSSTRGILLSSYIGTDYVLESYGRLLGGRVWGLGTRATNKDNLYSSNIYEDLDSANNLYEYNWVNGGASTLGRTAASQINMGQWYKLAVKVHGNSIDVYKDNSLMLPTFSSQYASGAAALYGERSTVAQFNNVLVRKYAATEPTARVQIDIPLIVTSVQLNPSSVLGGITSLGMVALNRLAPSGGVVVSLLSSATTVASVPGTVTLPEGSTTAYFIVTSSPVSSSTPVIISASYNGISRDAILTVNPLMVSSLQLNPSSVLGGTTSQATVVLNGPAPSGGAVVSLLSSAPTVASVPGTVTVPSGSANVSFTVTTSSVLSSTAVTITASYNGSIQMATLSVNPFAVSSLQLNPSSVLGGTTSQGTVALNGPAPSGGAVVSLLSSAPTVASVPGTVTVPSGSANVSFTVTTSSVLSSTAVTITASYNGSTQMATLTVRVQPGQDWLGPAWQYRNTIAITNAGSILLNDYQVRVALGSSFDFTKAKSDGGDVRFTSDDGVTLIPFWIEAWDPNNKTAILWVKVPSIPSVGASLYLYYGNPAALTASNGTTTFDFFDNFEGTGLNPQRWTSSGGSWTIVTGAQQDGSTGGVVEGVVGSSTREILLSSYVGTDYFFEAYGRLLGGRVWGLGTRSTNKDNLYSSNLYEDLDSTNNLYEYNWVNGGGSTLGSTAVGQVNMGQWYKLSVKVHGNSIDVYKDDNLRLTTSSSQYASGAAALYGERSTVAQFNNVLVRKYAAIEPQAVFIQ